MSTSQTSASDGSRDHLVVRASAGTGKTFALSNRFLSLLRRGAPPGSILATTFTRKAAGEILQRVLARLARGAADEANARELAQQLNTDLSLADTRALLATLAGALHRVSISTIDSFFNRVVQCFRQELGVPGDTVLVAADDPAAAQVRQDAIEAMLGDDDIDTLVDLLRRSHHDTAQRSVTAAIDNTVRSLYELYQQTEAAAWSVIDPPATLRGADYGRAINALRDLMDKPQGKREAKALHDAHEEANAGRWESFLGLTIVKNIARDGYDAMFYRKPIPRHVIVALRPMIDHAFAAVLGRLASRTRAMRDLLERFDRHYLRFCRAHRVMLFSDLTRKLAHDLPAMGDELTMHLYYRLDGVVAHLLLDEFQDTSIEQWSVLRPIAQEICAHGDADDGAAGRSFFCVGDVKQAIYGWRGGCAAIFDQVEHDLHLPPRGGATLSRSYRSSQVVLDAVNRVFTRLGDCAPLADHNDTAEQWQGGFVEHLAARQSLPGYVELITSPVGEPTTGDAGDDAGQSHLEYVAEYVRDLAARALPRGAAYIGVLVRTNNAVKQLIDLLGRAGVAASGEGGAPLTDDPAVNAVQSALLLADHPGHTAAAYHVVNSPLGQVVGLGSVRPNEVARTSQLIRAQLAADGYAATLTRWAKALVGSCDERSATRLTQLIELADAHDAGPATLRTRDFLARVESTAVEEPSGAAVRVMTVHKAKGLEFDIVVLPELQGLMARVNDLPAWAFRPSEADTPSALFATAKRDVVELLADVCPALREAREQETRRRLLDDLSGLYVAMTRPRYALHMIAEPLTQTASGAPSTKGLTNLTAASILRDRLRDVTENFEGGQVLHQHGDPDWFKAMPREVVAVPADHAPPRTLCVALAPPADGRPSRSWRSVAPSSLESSGRVRAADLLRPSVDVARQRGSVIHAWFAAVEWLDVSGPPDDASLLDLADAVALDADAAVVQRWLAEFRDMLEWPTVRRMLSRGEGRSADDDDAPRLWREKKFAVRMDDRLLSGAFDRVVVEVEQGGAIGARLIDFKTDSVAADGSHLNALVGQYRPQVDAYAKALSVMLDLPINKVEGWLLFVGADEAVRVELERS